MKIAIIGGGLTGLTAAFILSKKHDVTLFEKEDYLGGMASSYLVEWDGGKYPITKTYHHILDGDLTTIEFIRKFGLEKKFHRKKVKQGFIYKNKIFGFSTPSEILKFPTSFSDKFKLAKFILLDLKQKDLSKLDDIDAKRWITKKAGGTNYNVFFKQLIKNKFHDSPENITASWVITRLAKESSSFLKKFGWLEGGVVQIINGFEGCIKKNNGKIIMNAEVTSIRNKDKKLIYTKNGLKKEFKFNILISTIPPEVFLKVMDNVPDDIKEQLQKIRYLSCVCATFGLKKSLTGYYWLNVLDEGLPFSVVFNDTTLYEDASPKNKSVVYITTYLMNNEDLWKMSEEEIKAVYVDSIKKIIPGFEEQIEWWRIFKLKYAEAIYKVGFVNPPMNYDGIYFAGIYKIYPKIRNMASAMEEGEKIAEKITSDYNT